MIADCDEEALQAYDRFKHTISTINFRCWIVEFLLKLLTAIWGIKEVPQIQPLKNYVEGEGSRGYQERVIPPVFALSPFFSEDR